MKNAYEIKELLNNGGSICIYDTETTGLKRPESRILSFSAIIVRKVDAHLFLCWMSNRERDVPADY